MRANFGQVLTWFVSLSVCVCNLPLVVQVSPSSPFFCTQKGQRRSALKESHLRTLDVDSPSTTYCTSTHNWCGNFFWALNWPTIFFYLKLRRKALFFLLLSCHIKEGGKKVWAEWKPDECLKKSITQYALYTSIYFIHSPPSGIRK